MNKFCNVYTCTVGSTIWKKCVLCSYYTFFCTLKYTSNAKINYNIFKRITIQDSFRSCFIQRKFQKLHFWGNFSPVHCGIWSGTQELLDQQLKQEAYIYIPGYVNSLIFLWFWHFYNKCIFDSLKCQIKRALLEQRLFWHFLVVAFFTKEWSNHSNSRW